jgi:tripartite ATP-independent transporter DctP family solute receptor
MQKRIKTRVMGKWIRNNSQQHARHGFRKPDCYLKCFALQIIMNVTGMLRYEDTVTKTFKYLSAFLILLLLFLLSSCNRSGQDDTDAKTIILAHAMHPTHPVSIAMERMAEKVDRYSEGKLKVKIYPAAQLGSERKLLELIQIGTIGMTKVSAATMENIVPAMQVFSLPYLFRDKDHVFKVQDGEVGQQLLLEGVPYRLKGIAYYDAGSRSLYTTKRAVRSPEDLAGLKIRVMESVIAMRLMRTMGGSPTPLSYGELYTAFQGGIVDGAENNPPSFFTSRHYEVCSYYTLNEHSTIPDVLVIGTQIWENLNDEQRAWLRRAIDESVAFQRELWHTFEEESLETIEKSGVTIIYPDKEPFRRALEPLYDTIRQNNPDLYSWVERIRDVK